MLNLVVWPIFVFGSIPWIVLTAAAFLLLGFGLYERKNKVAYTAITAWLVLSIVFGDMTLIGYIIADPWGSALAVLEIIGMGAAWCLIAWGIQTCSRRAAYEKLKFDWLRSKGIDIQNYGGWSIFSRKEINIPLNLRQAWTDHLCSLDEYHSEFNPKGWWERVDGPKPTRYDIGYSHNVTKKRPVVKLHWWDYSKKHIREIIFWLPLSIWWVVTNAGKFIGRRIIKSISFIGDYISNLAFRGVDKDFEIPKEVAEVVEEDGVR